MIIALLFIGLLFWLASVTVSDLSEMNSKHKERQHKMDERKQILSGTWKNDGILNTASGESYFLCEGSFEERQIIKAFNKFIDEHQNLLVRERLRVLDKELGYSFCDDIKKLPSLYSSVESIPRSKYQLGENFEKLYEYFHNTAEWGNFIQAAKRTNIDLADEINNIFLKEFFNAYKKLSMDLGDGAYLIFLPCYVVHIIEKKQLKIIPYEKMQCEKKQFSVGGHYKYQNMDGSPDRRRKDNEYITEYRYYYQLAWKSGNKDFNINVSGYFAHTYNEYSKTFAKTINNSFFKSIFNVDLKKEQEQQLQAKINQRNEIFMGFESSKIKLLPCPKEREKYTDNLEREISNAYIKFINFKNKYNQIKEFNEIIVTKRTLLKKLNVELGYDEEKDIEKLQSEIAYPEEPNKYLDDKMVLLNQYFGDMEQWKEFIHAVKAYRSQTRKSFLYSDVDILYKEFFGEMDINVILLDSGTFLFLFPAFAVYANCLGSFTGIPYSRLKIATTYIDKKSNTKSVAGGKCISQEYTHQNLDGSPNKRYKNNPIIYIIRFSYLVFTVGAAKYTLPCNNADEFIETLNGYKNFLDEDLNTLILKKVVSVEDFNIESIISEYREKERKKAEKLKKQLKLEEKRRLEEERIRVEEEKQRKLAIIQKQRERNEELQRKKEISKKAMELFAEDNEKTDTISDAAQSKYENYDQCPLNVEGECLISNNVFKLVLTQTDEMNVDDYTVYFVDEDGNRISNTRKLQSVTIGEQVSTGVTLLSNIDFTTMDKCYLKIEMSEKEKYLIPYKMNISFYSDFD